MRWSLRLSEFDFVVEHKPGTKIKHADALSQHVGAIMEDSLPDKERFRKEQKQESFCSSHKLWTPTSNSEYFLDEDNVLCRRQSSGNHQLVVPSSLTAIQSVISQNSSYLKYTCCCRVHYGYHL